MLSRSNCRLISSRRILSRCYNGGDQQLQYYRRRCCCYISTTTVQNEFGSALEYAFTPDTTKDETSVLDSIIIRCVAGNGGDGAREYLKPTKRYYVGPGVPAGGLGGKGGDVVLRVGTRLSGFDRIYSELANLDQNNRGPKEYLRAIAEHGRPGKGKDEGGDAGSDFVLHVPVGTLVYDYTSVALRRNDDDDNNDCEVVNDDDCDGDVEQLEDEEKQLERELKRSKQKGSKKDYVTESGELIAELCKQDSEFIVAHGGSGGRGNTVDDPHHSTRGANGQSLVVRLVLKCLADVGLIGLPNAGKSTLIGAISQCRPKVSPEPFTTLAPNIGTIKYKDETSISVSDLPGIIEGAHANVGMGVKFLQHAERTKSLVFVIDMANTNIEPWEAFCTLRNELQKFSPTNLATKPFIVVANKCDVRPNDTLPKVDTLWEVVTATYPKTCVIPISARFGDGVSRFVTSLKQLVQNAAHT